LTGLASGGIVRPADFMNAGTCLPGSFRSKDLEVSCPKANATRLLRSEIDYDALIEKASPALRLYIGKLEQENARLRQEVMELRQLATRRQRAEVARETREEARSVSLATIHYPDDVMW